MSSAHGPLVVGVTDLLREPGKQRTVERAVPADRLEVGRSAIDAGVDVDIDLVLESVLGEAVTVRGTVAAPWTGECRRCLEPIAGVLEADVAELYERHPSSEESFAIVDDAVDLAPVVHDALVLALPLSPLCRVDCPGPSPDAYPVTVADDAAETAARDDRWAALDAVTFDDGEPADGA